jgi:hypothetical protein
MDWLGHEIASCQRTQGRQAFLISRQPLASQQIEIRDNANRLAAPVCHKQGVNVPFGQQHCHLS